MRVVIFFASILSVVVGVAALPLSPAEAVTKSSDAPHHSAYGR
ncbi:hypothetical protein [Methylopila turkensis]|uniref:Uncharacterized protein n=1 Tax=Methylopila turkensis TaxID=1437816 RepID=A0A9W6JR03_9HYPH|nr:hypothetical protein [Methylopila turkensis]GLK80435.1 hypothetical protein GCM10008174_21760 [Methylopila turkensis]